MRLLLMLALAADTTYFRDVLPLLRDNCIGCHAHGVNMGSLDLETWDGIQRGGNQGTILVPGKPDESRLYTMLVGKAEPRMPLDGRVFPLASIEAIRRWISAGALPGLAPQKPKTQIYSMAWRPDGGALALGRHQVVDLVEPATQKTLASFAGHAEFVRAVAFTRDGKMLAAAGGIPGRKGEVKLWSASDGKLLVTMTGHADCIYAIAFSPDGKTLATASYDKLIKLWSVESGQEIRTLKDHIDAIYALAFTPDGQRLLSGSADRSVKIWNPATGERLYTLSEPTDGISTLAVSPDGQRVAAAGGDKQIRVWKLSEKSGQLLQSQIAHEDQILKLAWSPDGKTIASASADKSIKLFNAADLVERKAIPGQTDWVYGLEFSPDGRQLAAGRYDGSLNLYVP